MPDSSNNLIKILLIEDNPDHVEIIKNLLSEIKTISFDLEHTTLLAEGLQLLADKDFDLVLLDPTLPDSQRLDTLKKTYNCSPDVPIIVVSSLEDELLAAQAVNWGVQDCLIKDQLTSSLLSRSIGYAIERKHIGKELARHRQHLEDLVQERTTDLTKTNKKLKKGITERKQIEEELRASEEKFRKIFDNANIMIWGTYSDGKIRIFNKEAERVMGYSQEEALGMINMSLHPPEEREELLEKFKNHKEGVKKKYLELGVYTKDRKRLKVLLAQATFKDATGEDFYVALMQDITERKRAEEELAQHRQHLEEMVNMRTVELSKTNQQLIQEVCERKRAGEALYEEKDKAQNYLDIAGVIMLVLDADGKITLTNKKGCEILGEKCLDTNCDDLIGKDWFSEFIPEKDRESTKAVFSKLMAGEIAATEYYENVVLTKMGQEKTIAWHNTVLKGKNGKILGTLSSGEDITERKIAEESLQSSNSLLCSLVESPSDVIILSVDKGFNYTFFNTAHVKEMKKVWGVDIELGKSLLDYIPSDEEREKVRKNFGQILRGERVKRVESYGGPEKKFWYELSYNPIFDENSNVIGVTVFIVDISLNMRAQEVLKKNHDELEIRVKERTIELEEANPDYS